jgi:peptide-methionine (R)-S-oxide reductase
MKTSIKSLLSVCFLGGLLTAWLLHAQPQQSMITSSKTPGQPQQPVKKSDAEWKQLLTPEQYRIARQSGTEAPNGKIYEQFKKQGAGTYYCAGCNAKLFSSKEKFDSHCGWPSFYDPANAKNIKQIPDPDGRRIEVRCAVCDAHLGHVFKGEGFNTPTDLRYCINGTVLKFVPDQKK